MKKYNYKKGQAGEAIACRYLENKGYRLRQANYKKPTGEIDLILEKDQTIVFVEVKFRKNLDYGYPREAVTRAKQKRILQTALWYIKEKKCDNYGFRFDVLEIYDDQDKQIINHFEHAFTY